MTSSNGNIFRVTGICAGNSSVAGEFRAQWPVTRNFDVFFDLCLNIRLSKQSWGWWFETQSRPLWRHSAVYATKPQGNVIWKVAVYVCKCITSTYSACLVCVFGENMPCYNEIVMELPPSRLTAYTWVLTLSSSEVYIMKRIGRRHQTTRVLFQN